jgi:transcriptional regulator with XRE-family HTH domain
MDILIMKTIAGDLNKLLDKDIIGNELDFERASILDRKLRVLVHEHPELADKRKKLDAMLQEYEDRVWINAEITEEKIQESDIAKAIAEQEWEFIFQRKNLIKVRLKGLSLTQKDLGKILGHTSISYMSELMNGIYPFTMQDLIILHLLLKIDFDNLIPTFLGINERSQIAEVLNSIGNLKIRLNQQTMELIAI